MTDWAIDIVIKEDLAKALYDSWSETLPRDREWFDEHENVRQAFLRSAEVMLSVPAVRFAFEDSEVLANTTNVVRDLLQENEELTDYVDELHGIIDDIMFERDSLAQNVMDIGLVLEGYGGSSMIDDEDWAWDFDDYESGPIGDPARSVGAVIEQEVRCALDQGDYQYDALQADYDDMHRIANRSLDLAEALLVELNSLTATKNNKRRWFRRKK